MEPPDPRYLRQMLLPGVGREGQQRLRAASVLLVGVGGLGCPVALYLAAAGVGRLVLVDDDRVDTSNLHRQVLYGPADVGRLKVEVAAERLRALNADVAVEARPERLTAANARALVGASDVVVDGSDTFATRYLTSDACVLEGRPCVHASVLRYEAQVTVLHHAGGPCYRCLYPSPPPAGLLPDCNEGGVLGPVVGMAGLLQATETLKLLLDVGSTLAGRLLVLDALGTTTRTLGFTRRDDCPSCGDAPTIRDVSDLFLPEACDTWTVEPAAARVWLASDTPPVLLDVRSREEHEQQHIGGSVVPLGELDAVATCTLDPACPVLVYCLSGARSARAAALLRKAGVAAYSLRGGMQAWLRMPA